MENTRDILQPDLGKIFLKDITMQKHEAHRDCGQILLLHESEAGGKHFYIFIQHFLICRIMLGITKFSYTCQLNQDQLWLPAKILIE